MARGASARENCPTDIKLALLEGPKNFEAIVESLKDKYSRGTINKYLGELFKDGLATRQGRRGPYELTPEGRRKAEHDAIMNRITKSLKKEPLEKLKELEVILDKWAKNSYRANAIKAIETELKEKKKMLESYLVLHEELKCKTEQAKGYRKEKLKKLLESSEDTLAYWKEQVQKLIMEKENIEKDLKEFEAIRNKVKEIEKSFEKLQKGLTP